MRWLSDAWLRAVRRSTQLVRDAVRLAAFHHTTSERDELVDERNYFKATIPDVRGAISVLNNLTEQEKKQVANKLYALKGTSTDTSVTSLLLKYLLTRRQDDQESLLSSLKNRPCPELEKFIREGCPVEDTVSGMPAHIAPTCAPDGPPLSPAGPPAPEPVPATNASYVLPNAPPAAPPEPVVPSPGVDSPTAPSLASQMAPPLRATLPWQSETDPVQRARAALVWAQNSIVGYQDAPRDSLIGLSEWIGELTEAWEALGNDEQRDNLLQRAGLPRLCRLLRAIYQAGPTGIRAPIKPRLQAEIIAPLQEAAQDLAAACDERIRIDLQLELILPAPGDSFLPQEHQTPPPYRRRSRSPQERPGSIWKTFEAGLRRGSQVIVPATVGVVDPPATDSSSNEADGIALSIAQAPVQNDAESVDPPQPATVSEGHSGIPSSFSPITAGEQEHTGAEDGDAANATVDTHDAAADNPDPSLSKPGNPSSHQDETSEEADELDGITEPAGGADEARKEKLRRQAEKPLPQETKP